MSEETNPANRGRSGGNPPEHTRFKPGQSGNPSGRAKIPVDLKNRLKDMTPEVITFWNELLKDKKAKNSDRIKVSELIMDRAWGKPLQQVDMSADVVQTKVDISSLKDDEQSALLSAVTAVLFSDHDSEQDSTT
jgi:hypothetical protein